MRVTLCLAGAVCALALCNAPEAQSPAASVVPNIGKGTASSNSSYPWNRTTSPVRVQYAYDSTEMPPFPITITRIRFRPYDGYTSATTWTGGTYGGITMLMSTASTDYSQITTTFSTNHGADVTTVYSGSVNLAAGAGTGAGVPSNYYVDMTLQKPFSYDPSKGDFLLDIASDGSKYTGGTTAANAVTYTADGNKATRMYNLTSHTATTGTLQANVGLVCEITYTFSGVFADFTASPTNGLGPTKVQFTDLSLTSDAGGISAWLWDLDGDSNVDSNAQNPTFNYTKAGSYDVTLQVIAKNGTAKKTKKGFINIIIPSKKDRTVPDIIQYQFNDVRGKTSNVVVNSANGTAAGDGTMSITNWAGDPGRAAFNPNESGLGMVASGTTGWINSGWALSAKDMTVMFWLRKNSTNTNPFGYCFGKQSTTSQFRSFVAGAAGNGITFRGSSIGTFDSGGDIQTNKNGVWQHMCLVIDNTNGKASWYIDGNLSNTLSFTANSFNESDSGFTVGAVGSGTSPLTTHYDYDDFRFYSTALTATQVAAAAAYGENASTGAYGTACSSTTSTPSIAGNSQPLQGNSGFGVNVTGAAANAPGLMLVSFWASAGLPIDVSKQAGVTGCMLELLPALILPTTTTSTGTAFLPLPVPIDPVNLPGFHAYCQFGYKGAAGTGVTKGLDINIQ